MSLSGFRHWGFAGLWMVAWIFSPMNIPAATIVAGPGEAGFRAAIAAAQDGDTVILTNYLELQATVAVNKRITLTVDPVEAWRISIRALFAGEMLDLVADGIVLDGLKMYGSAQTDALRVEGVTATLRDCIIADCRRPVVAGSWYSGDVTLRLERVTISNNQQGIGCQSLEAKHCTFSRNGGWSGVGATTVDLDGCVIENNLGQGLTLINGTIKNCVFRYNNDYALYFDPDNGYMCLKSCLFYANPGGGIYLREGAYATIDNCTFTRHTGRPAVVVDEVHDILFRHCTVSDNVVIGGGDPWTYPYYPAGAAFWIMEGHTATLENCLIADNPTDDDPNASGLVGTHIDGGGNVIGGAANLSGLRDNGGPTLSLLPLPGSPAIDAGRPSDVVRDARGLSRHAGAAPDAGAIESGAAALADTDADGLPNIWERLHALNPDDPADAASDTDRDGQSALAEFHSSTDPADRQSVHRTEEIIVGYMSIYQPYPRWGYLKWTRYPAVFYHVEVSHDLRTWRRLPDAASPDGPTISFSLGQIYANSPTSFYRVVAVK